MVKISLGQLARRPHTVLSWNWSYNSWLKNKPKSYWMGLKDIIDLQLSQESIWFMHSSIKEYYSAYLGSWTLKVSRATGRRTGGWSRLWRQGAGGKSGWGGSRQIRVSVPPTLAASKSYNLSPSQPKKAYFPFFWFWEKLPIEEAMQSKASVSNVKFSKMEEMKSICKIRG